MIIKTLIMLPRIKYPDPHLRLAVNFLIRYLLCMVACTVTDTQPLTKKRKGTYTF